MVESIMGLLWQSNHIMDVIWLRRKHNLQSGSWESRLKR
jgi:hypothetical protein